MSERLLFATEQVFCFVLFCLFVSPLYRGGSEKQKVHSLVARTVGFCSVWRRGCKQGSYVMSSIRAGPKER